ncbi:MAG TPA: YjjG family noncanonical pyrimidine nucleotidase [Bacteroidia bacterium]|nr:YjjG family noncanonical pyrimidine nucleotidase [Bacteroidia bacterium]
MAVYKHLFFDLDRTLWDMERNARETLVELYHKYDLASRGIDSAEDFVDHYNHYNHLLWDRYQKRIIDKATLRALRFKQSLAHFGVHDEELAANFDRDYISEAPNKKNLIPGTIELLESIKEDYRLHIITNGFPEVQHHKLSRSGLESYFETIITSEGCGYAKPDARIFSYALKKAKAVAEESLMIGDDLNIDIVGAREAGWHQVFFNPSGGQHKEKVTYEIRRLKELQDMLQKKSPSQG